MDKFNRMIANRNIIIISLWGGVFLLTVCLPIYADNDSYAIAMVLNLSYGVGEHYTIFQHPLITAFSDFIHCIFPNADCYTLLSEILALVGMFISYYSFSKILKNKRAFITGCLGFAFIFIDLNIPHSNFTVLAGYLTFCGFLALYVYLFEQEELWALFSGIIFILLGAMWRIESFLLFIPQIVLILACYFATYKKGTYKGKKSSPKRILVVFVVIFVLFVSILIYKQRILGDALHIQSLLYSIARSNVLDYPRAEWASIAENASEQCVSETDYKLATTWFLADTDIIDAKFLQNIGALSNISKDFRIQNIIYCIYQIVVRFLLSPQLLVIFVPLVAITSILILKCQRQNKYMDCWLLLLSCFIACFIILWMKLQGRIPNRVIVCILFSAWLNVFYVIGTSEISLIQNPILCKRLWLIVSTVLVLACCSQIIQSKDVIKQSVWNAFGNIEYASFEEEIDNDEAALYIWEVSAYSDFQEMECYTSGVLLTEPFLSHNIPDGGWCYGQPFFLIYCNG